MSGRTRWIDSARGIGIALVVAGHNPGLWSEWPEVGRILFAFHMPLFFAIVGTTLPRRPAWRSTLLRAAALLISYASLCLLSLPLALKRADYQSLGQTLLGVLYGTGHTIVIPPLWFLPCLAVALPLVHGLDLALARFGPRAPLLADAAGAAATGVAGLLVLLAQGPLQLAPRLGWGNEMNSGAVLNLDLVLLGVGFIFFGRLLGKLIQDHAARPATRWGPITLSLALLFALLYGLLRPHLDMNMRIVEPGFAALLIAAVGSAATLFAARLIQDTRAGVLTAQLGTKTLLILWLHAGIEKRAWEALPNFMPAPLAVFVALAVALVIPFLLDHLLTYVPKLRAFIYPQAVLGRLAVKKPVVPVAS